MTQLGLEFDAPERRVRQLGAREILAPSEMQEINAAVTRVHALMRDGNWHTREEIEAAASPAAEGMRRLRDLRRWFIIDRERFGDERIFYYRLRTK